jgi:hypothetical protein
MLSERDIVKSGSIGRCPSTADYCGERPSSKLLYLVLKSAHWLEPHRTDSTGQRIQHSYFDVTLSLCGQVVIRDAGHEG